MDSKDRPLRVLVAGPGAQTYLPFDGTVTQKDYDNALAYFEERAPPDGRDSHPGPCGRTGGIARPRRPALPLVPDAAG
ncbi:hypothetical protein [Streptomyces sp. NPDC087856]|uniref:DUF7639 domain-containing protein n=1 Tax=Streptomyces sp. NPDC087856 TaxID=3365811 RepID=UPI0037FCD03B